MESENNPVSRQSDIVVQELKEEVLVYDLLLHKVYCLNKTSALVWHLCDGNNSPLDISKQLTKKLKSPISENLVFLAIDDLKKIDLIENDFVLPCKGMSRREVVRKAAFGSIVAFPVISLLVAPTAANAQSRCFGPGTTAFCVNNASECATFAPTNCLGCPATASSTGPCASNPPGTAQITCNCT